MSKEITNVSIDILKIHPRNNEFFDDITGKEYEDFKKSVAEEGIISEIIVAPDMTIISGHQRYKAAKDLGMKLVPIRIRDDLQDEDKKLRVLLASNFGRNKNNEAKQRKVAVEYVKLCGYGQGRPEKDANMAHLSLDEISSQLGMSKRNLQRAISIENKLTEPMKELLDDGVISKTVAADLIASLTEEEQLELISSLDTTKKITKREVQQYIDNHKDQKPEPVIIDNTDYESIGNLEKRIEQIESEKKSLERKVKMNQEDADKFNKLKSDIEFLTKQKNSLGRQINSATELSGLTVELQNLLEKTLAPIKFKRCMEVLDSSDVCVQNLTEIVDKIDSWSAEMQSILTEQSGSYQEIIDVSDDEDEIEQEEMRMGRKCCTVFSQKLAGFLMMKGFVLVDTMPDLHGSGRNVFYFKDSPELHQASREYRDMKGKNQ